MKLKWMEMQLIAFTIREEINLQISTHVLDIYVEEQQAISICYGRGYFHLGLAIGYLNRSHMDITEQLVTMPYILDVNMSFFQ